MTVAGGRAVGDSGTIQATADGGCTWRSQPLSFIAGVLKAVDFANARLGWIVNGSGRIYATRTGGAPGTVGPATCAKAVCERRGKTLTLRFKVVDDTSTEAYGVRVIIKLRSGTVKSLRSPTPLRTGVWHSVKWRPKARGK